MRREDALAQAAKIARLIIDGSRKLGGTPLNELPLLATLPLLAIASKGVWAPQLDPRIDEILIFGSVARDEDTVGDIDMMVLDRGFYSSSFQSRIERVASRNTDWYQSLDDNLRELLTGWFGLDETNEAVVEALAESVDLHILPLELLRSSAVKQKIAKHHRDPEFFENAFSHVLRWERWTSSFEPTTLAYIEERYHVRTQAEAAV